MLWLWYRQAAVAPIGPLAWEPPQAMGVALRSQKKKKKQRSRSTSKFKQASRAWVQSGKQGGFPSPGSALVNTDDAEQPGWGRGEPAVPLPGPVPTTEAAGGEGPAFEETLF